MSLTFADFKAGEPVREMFRKLRLEQYLEAATSWQSLRSLIVDFNDCDQGRFVKLARRCDDVASSGERTLLHAILFVADFAWLADELTEGRAWFRMDNVSGAWREAVAACILTATETEGKRLKDREEITDIQLEDVIPAEIIDYFRRRANQLEEAQCEPQLRRFLRAAAGRFEAKEKVSAAKVSKAIKAGCSEQHGSCSYPNCAGAECEFFGIAIRTALEAAAEEGRSRE